MVDAGSIFSEVRIRLDMLKQDISSVEAEFDKFGTKNKEQTTKVEQDWSKGFNAASIAGVAAFVAIGAAVKAAIGVFIEFDSAMAGVHATMTGSEQDFADMEAAALKMGSTTEFSSKEAADSLLYLSQKGRDAAESIAILNQAQLLAGASGGSLIDATKMLTQIMAQFGLGADSANRIVEVIAASKIPLTDFGNTLSTIGPVAASMGISLESLVGVMKVVQKTGMESGQATMALKTIFAELSDSTSSMVKKLDSMGVSFNQVNPATNTFAQIVGNLTKAGIGADAAMAAFGARSGPVLAALLREGQEGLEQITASITGTSVAAEMQATRNNTLEDSLKTLQNAVGASASQIIKEFAPAMKSIVDVLTSVVAWVGNLPGPLKIFFGVAAIGIPVILGIAAAVQILGTVLTASAGIISIIVLGIAALAAGFSALPHLFDPVTIAADRVRGAHEELQKATESLNESLEVLNELQKDLEKNTKNLTEAEKLNRLERIEREKNNLLGVLEKEVNALINMEKIQKDLNKQMDDNLKKQQDYTKGLEENAKVEEWEITNNATLKVGRQQLSDQYDGLLKNQKQNNENLEKGIDALARQNIMGIISIETIRKQGPAIAELVEARKKLIADEDAAAAKKKSDDEAEAARTRARTEATLKYKQSIDFVNGVLEEQKTTLDKLHETLTKLEAMRLKGADELARQKAIAEVTEKIKDEEEKLAKAREKSISLLDEYKQKFADLYANQIEQIENQRQAALDSIDKTKKGWVELTEAVNKYYDALVEKTKQEQFVADMQKTVSDINSAFQSLGNSINTILGAVGDRRMEELDRAMQAELEAAGVAEETAIEKAQAELAAAQETGDAKLIKEKQDALTRLQIEQDYERKKAQLQYETAHAQWAMTLAMTFANAAAAVITAFPNIPLMIVAGIVGAVATAAVAAQEPQAPTFEYGGIVMGSSYSGDRVPAMVNSGEMILTQEHQARLLALANGGGQGSGGRGIMQVALYMDMRKVAEGTAEYFEGGLVRLVLT